MNREKMKIEYDFDFDYLNGFYIKINGKTNYYDIIQLLKISYDKYTDLLTQFNSKYKKLYGMEGYYFDREEDCKNFIKMIERDYNSNNQGNNSQNNKKSGIKVGDKVKMINPTPYHGLRGIRVGDIGKVVEIERDIYFILFPRYNYYWSGAEEDLEIVEAKKEEKEGAQRKQGEITWGELETQIGKDYPNYVNSPHAKYEKPKPYEEKIGKNRKIKIIEEE